MPYQENVNYEIELGSGAYLDLSDPDPNVITVEVIAAALSKTCRYSGQARRFYSVAEHACLVEDRLRGQGAPWWVRLAGLHHDDAEAFTSDLTRPLKLMLPGFREIEERLALAIQEGLRLPPLLHPAQRDEVKSADDWALSCEAQFLMPSRGVGWWCEGLYDVERDGPRALGLEPKKAEEMFLVMHAELTGEAEIRSAA